jgi:hypothetical protein
LEVCVAHNLNYNSDTYSGCHDGGYTPFLANLMTQDHSDKLTLLTGGSVMHSSIQELGLKTFDIPDLFECEPPVVTPITPQVVSAPSTPWNSPPPKMALTSLDALPELDEVSPTKRRLNPHKVGP